MPAAKGTKSEARNPRSEKDQPQRHIGHREKLQFFSVSSVSLWLEFFLFRISCFGFRIFLSELISHSGSRDDCCPRRPLPCRESRPCSACNTDRCRGRTR